MRLIFFALFITLGAPAVATPVVTTGPPIVGSFLTADPSSLQVEMLGVGETVDLQLSITIHPFCIIPIDLNLVASGDGGTFANQTGQLTNGCGNDTSVFNIRLTGDGAAHIFQVDVVDSSNGQTLVSIPVRLFPAMAMPVLLGEPLTDGFSTIDPGSIRIYNLDAGAVAALRLSMTVHPFCFLPIPIVLDTTGDGGSFADLTGQQINDCGDDISEFDITLTGDGTVHTFEIVFRESNSNSSLASIPVYLSPQPPPEVTLGPPVDGNFASVDPGSILVESLGDGDFVELQISLTVHPFCVRPIHVVLVANGNAGTFADQSGLLVNGCGGDTTVFDIRLTGDGLSHSFDIDFVDDDSGATLFSIPVQLLPPMVDTDRDGIFNLTDNCTEVFNPDQYDSNNDRIGNICDADISGPAGTDDCQVNFRDLQAFQDAFFSNPTTRGWNPHADLDNSGSVNFADLQIVKNQFFGRPGPSASGCN